MKTRVLLIASLTVTGSLIAGYIFGVHGYLASRMARAHAEIVKTEEAIADLQTKTKQIPTLRAQNGERTKTVQTLHARLVRPQRVSETLADLQKLCRQYQVKLVRVSFSPDSLLSGMKLPASARESTPLPVLMELQGQFLDSGLLIEHFGKLPYAISVTDFRFLREEKQKSLTIELRTWLRIAREV